MEIIEKLLTEIKPYENNPRKNEDTVQYVANSIKSFGFKVPVIIDKNNVIVCGHTRYEAAKSLGMKSVPCIMADDLNEQQIKAYRLADNKVAEKAEWDYELLTDELNGLKEYEYENEISMEDFGFSPEVKDIDFTDEDFVKDTEINKTKAKTCTCPECGYVFEV